MHLNQMQYVIKSMKQFNILVVDDDKEIVEVLTKLLTLEGYQVYQAYDGIEAVQIVNINKINLILLDVMMPKLNGISAMMKIREKNNIPILILSAKTEESDKVAGLVMGADDYIEKPFNTAELLARVKAQLRRYFTLVLPKMRMRNNRNQKRLLLVN